MRSRRAGDKPERSDLEISGTRIEMQTALVFHTIKSRRLGITVFCRPGAVPITHRNITFFRKRMTRQVVLMKLQIHLRIGPIENRVGLESFFLTPDKRPVRATA